jgi:hypothetical protein
VHEACLVFSLVLCDDVVLGGYGAPRASSEPHLQCHASHGPGREERRQEEVSSHDFRISYQIEAGKQRSGKQTSARLLEIEVVKREGIRGRRGNINTDVLCVCVFVVVCLMKGQGPQGEEGQEGRHQHRRQDHEAGTDIG